MLRETALIPMDIADAAARKILRRSCVRAASAYDAALSPIDAGPVGKVTVALWSTARPDAESHLPEKLGREDDVVELGVSASLSDLLAMPPDARAVDLLTLHHAALCALSDRYGWEREAFDTAFRVARQGGVVARLSLAPVHDRTGRWEAVASGRVDEDGLHVALTLQEVATGRLVASPESTMNGDWHLLRALLNKVVWRGGVAKIQPLRSVAGGLPLPEVSAPSH